MATEDAIKKLGTIERQSDKSEEINFSWMNRAKSDFENVKEVHSKGRDSLFNLNAKIALDVAQVVISKKDASEISKITRDFFDVEGSFSNAMEDLQYAIKDAFYGRKRKTAITILTGIGTGMGLGAAIGTFVLPGLGTLVGGGAGVVVAGGFGLGVLGLAGIGGLLGSWVASNVSKKIYKDEKHYGLSGYTIGKLQSKMNIQSEVAERTNAYLYNRAKSAKATSPLLQETCKAMRKLAIEEADPYAWVQVAHFLCHELRVLRKEIKQTPPGDQARREALIQDKEAVKFILHNLRYNTNFPKWTRTEIKGYLRHKYYSPENKHAPHVSSDKKDAEVVKPRFAHQEKVKSNIKKQESAYAQSGSFVKKEKGLPDILVASEEATVGCYVDISDLKANNEQAVVVSLRAQMQSALKGNSESEVYVRAGGNERIAVQLLVEAWAVGVQPQLHETEFNTEQSQRIFAQARELCSGKEATLTGKHKP